MADVIRQSVAASGRHQRASLNARDLVELLPGAQPSANPAQREQFESRCRQVHSEDVAAGTISPPTAARYSAGVTGLPPGFDELIEMFPSLEPSLIAAIARESRTQAGTVETLLVLAAAAEHPNGSFSTLSALPRPKPDDFETFPVLADADGWQVCGSRASPDSGSSPSGAGASSWSERAKAVAQAPAPKAVAKPTAAPTHRRKPKNSSEEGDGTFFDEGAKEEYELRHWQGRRREVRRSLLGRGGKAAAKPAGAAPGPGSDGESEASEDTAVGGRAQ